MRREPLRYEPTLWGMVFPLGMYMTGTLQLSRALDLAFLAAVPAVFIHLTLLAWGLTFLGLLGRNGATLLLLLLLLRTNRRA
ncbi:hypothetical protein GCM10011320_48820 [Neoroseomonas lacus]|uniref:Uncharacterized protein n=1 Tax=Neoroseomonas lacus TaxID=287609 RepID=A0A917KZV3_9PROT|nr:hypothetical protein GCM10011320_48820 [Neoroseomonas lacus]